MQLTKLEGVTLIALMPKNLMLCHLNVELPKIFFLKVGLNEFAIKRLISKENFLVASNSATKN